MKLKHWVFGWAALFLFGALAQPAHAGACLCVKRNMEGETVEFKCVNQNGDDGVAGCSTYCKKNGYNGYQWFADDTCNSLMEKIKGEKIKLKIKDIQIGPIGIGVDTKAVASTSATAILVGQGSIEPIDDTFTIPGGLGGGSYSTSGFGGTIHFRLEPSTTRPNLYTVVVTGVDTTADSMNLNGYETGALHGDLNPEGYNRGELDTTTGKISILFSQLIYADSLPGVPITSHSAYFGTCNNCLNGGTVSLSGDSIFISPLP
jgi:hypothetical protein